MLERLLHVPHGNELLMSFGLIVRGDGDLLSSGELDGLPILEESCADLWALQMMAALLREFN